MYTKERISTQFDLAPAASAPELMAGPTAEAIPTITGDVKAFAIDPQIADTAALLDATGLGPETSANCVLVSGTRSGEERIAACMVLANTRADVNKRVKKILDVRKASFLPMERAVSESGMEYGGIGPIGLPANYRILVDSRVAEADELIIGSGIRGSKLILSGPALASLPTAEVVEGLANEIG
ncbi:YbaK/EbsC family protein [Brevibacterium marinum]|uniref:Prolyl-tRNA editing enzyme YbaK/EbsC (Cys-tRNA(Pro) deacylase) n=1 Tax=Brevibacterium marinum TaxID=418643 RepID=A0A846RTN9_9MICO|nr:YbaK/EbsC family protein [Brevibacterium marinum]NJC57474.1 prolyl-tRNA editing enzyme YbaK/EbsC (Cys-tRNA(Pro) deacylase) [Brevibacterium marinum]